MIRFSPILIFVLCCSFASVIEGNITDVNAVAQNQGANTKNDEKLSDEHQEQTGDSEKNEIDELEPSHLTGLQNYDPFILMRSTFNAQFQLTDYRLPTHYIEEYNGALLFAAKKVYIFQTALCPVLEINTRSKYHEVIQSVLELITKDVPASKNCLFASSGNQSKCTKEPKAVIEVKTKEENESVVPVTCGINNQQQFLATEFHNCGTQNDIWNYTRNIVLAPDDDADKLILPPFHFERYAMYEACYDFEHQQILWTMHEIPSPALLAHKKYPYGSLNTIDIEELSTDTYDTQMNRETLEDLKKLYASTGMTKSTVYNLVPKKHMALPYWKKSTSHMTNTAPLLPKFIPLTEAINEGIFKAYAYALAKFQRKLKIYTKAKTIISKSSTPESSDLFEPNTWYRFIFEEETKSGILIVLHNTEEEIAGEKECKDDKTRCDFQKWTSAENHVPEETLGYAYCCPVTQERIEELFSMKDSPLVLKQLDLEEMIRLYPEVVKMLLSLKNEDIRNEETSNSNHNDD